MKNFSLFHPYWMSFYSRDLYRDVAKNWKGIAALYLFILLAIALIPDLVHLNDRISRFLRDDGPQIVEQIPTITIRNGIASIDKPVPHVIREPDTGMVFGIIDTSGEIISLENREADILLTKTQLIVRDKNQKVSIYELSGFKDMQFDKHDAHGLLNSISKWVVYALYPVILLISFVFRLLQATLYAAIGLLFAKRLKVDLTYQELLRIAVIALTPAIILSALFDWLTYALLFEWFLNFAISIYFVYFGVKSNIRT